MATMNISLPDKMREWIDRQVATGRFANASDFVRDLIRDAQTRVERDEKSSKRDENEAVLQPFLIPKSVKE